MANVNQFDLRQVIGAISKAAPPLLIICALGSFAVVTFFLLDYYEELFKPRFGESAIKMALMVAIIQELVRFCLLVSSVRDFSEGKSFNGWLGMIGSLYLVYHDVSVASELSSVWGGVQLKGVLLFLITIGLILEIRLVLTIGGMVDQQTDLPTNQNAVKTDLPTEESQIPTDQPKSKKKKKYKGKKPSVLLGKEQHLNGISN